MKQILQRYNCDPVKVTGGGVYDLIIAKGWLNKEKLDELLKPENMTHPRLVS